MWGENTPACRPRSKGAGRCAMVLLALALYITASAAMIHHMPSLPVLMTDLMYELRDSTHDQNAFKQGKGPSIFVRTLLRAPDTMLVTCDNCACDICVGMGLNKRGEFAPTETAIFAHILGRGCNNSVYITNPGKPPLVVDVGANIGYFTMLSASFGCRVNAFEPQYVPRLMIMSSTLVNGYGDMVTIYPYGLAAAAAKGAVKDAGSWGFASVDKTGDMPAGGATQTADTTGITSFGAGVVHHPGLKNWHRTHDHRAIELMPLSSIVQEDVLLMKVDTEGFEQNVFAGAGDLLSKYKVHNVVVEVKRFNDPDKRELLQKLVNAGLKYVYNYHEAYFAEVPAGESFNIKGAIKDVTDIIVNRRDSEKFDSEDFWLRREPLDL